MGVVRGSTILGGEEPVKGSLPQGSFVGGWSERLRRLSIEGREGNSSH